MKKILFTLLLITVSYLSQAQFNSNKDPFLVKSLTTETFQKVNVTTTHGNITVSVASAAEARIEVFIHDNAGNNQKLSKDEIQARLDEYYTLEVAVANGELTAVAKQKNNTINFKKQLSISFTIYTAQPVSNYLRTTHGNIGLSGMNGTQDFSTTHGNINIENCSGKLTGQTTHGNITVNGSSNEIDLGTTHGNVTVTNCEGTIKLTTTNGDVGLKKLKGNIHASSNHGNIGGDTVDGELAVSTSHGNIDFLSITSSVDASTSHGNIVLQLPKGKGLNIDLYGKSIRVDKVENFNGSKEEHSMKGSLNGGGTTVKANTTKGAVSLEFK